MLSLTFLIKALKLYAGYAFALSFMLQSSITLTLALVAGLSAVWIRQQQVRQVALRLRQHCRFFPFCPAGCKRLQR